VIGSRLGPYQVVAPLGSGGMGEVYKARDTRLGRDVAIKVLPAEYTADADRLRRFEQEARADGQLNHPNILTVFDVGTHEGAPYVVTELLEGETLQERLRPAGPPVRKTVEIAIQIARGLAAWLSGSPPRIMLLPTGAGEPRDLPVPGIEACTGLGWTRDGRLLVSGFEAGKGKRVYRKDPKTGNLTPMTEQGVYFDAFMPPKASPDGTSFLARSRDGTVIVPLRERGGEPRPVKSVEAGEKVVGWCADSRSLFVVRWGPFPIQVWTLDPDTGHRQKARTIDPKGYHGAPAENVFLTPDGKRGAMLTRLWHSELFVVRGLK